MSDSQARLDLHRLDETLSVARQCRQILGANGICLEFQAGRHMCNLESTITPEGTYEVHTLALGQAITGESAFR